jgi:SAM-dependent methyltransferase
LSPHDAIADHNRLQRAYFGQRKKRTMVPEFSPYQRRHVDMVLRAANVAEGDRVLEIGCGMGRYTLEIARRGIEVEGFDLSPELLAWFREYAGDRWEIPLHCGDLIDPPEALLGRFDVAVCFFTLHHLHALEECLLRVPALLRRCGRVAFLEPNPLNPLYYAQIVLTPGMRWKAEKGILNMRPSRVLEALRTAGMSDLRTTRFGFFPPSVANRKWGAILERRLEDIRLLEPILPFQVFSGCLSDGR